MDHYGENLKKFMEENRIAAEHLLFMQSCHTVEEAARAAKASVDEFVKNVCMIDAKGNLIVAIVKGADRASTTKIGELLKTERPRLATPEEVSAKTGYPCGGTPSFGYSATFIIDENVMGKNTIYTGGGSENSLVKISTKELKKANGGIVAKIRKQENSLWWE